MRAAVYSQLGPAREVLRIVDRPRPEPGPGEVRVRIACSGVNPSDTKSRAGLRAAAMPFPEVIPHSDGAGVIDAVGEGVDPMRRGERVWLWNAGWKRACGTAAEWAVLPSAQAVFLAPEIPFEIGACFGIPGLTACHAVLMNGGVSGKCVLVAGGAGSVGYYAVQMARLAGAKLVIATVSSAEKAALASAAGAHHCVNYREGRLAEQVLALTEGKGVERIIEVDLAANTAADFEMLASGGEIIVYGSGAPEASIPFVPAIMKNARVEFFIVYRLSDADRTRDAARLIAWVRAEVLDHLIGARLPLERIAEAHELVEQGGCIGNVVLRVADLD